MSAPRPFAIHVPDAVLTDLRVRLERTRWPDEVPDGGWRYGSEGQHRRRGQARCCPARLSVLASTHGVRTRRGPLCSTRRSPQGLQPHRPAVRSSQAS